jgi:hypothetical protein
MTTPHITFEQAVAIDKQDPDYWYAVVNERIDAVNKIALAEQQESEYITAAQARELGAGNAEYQGATGTWYPCYEGCSYTVNWNNDIKYRAVKKAQPETIIKQFGTIYEKNGDIFLDGFVADGCGTTDDSITALAKAVIKRINLELGKPEPSDPHATLRAEYAKQVKEGTRKFYLWEYLSSPFAQWIECKVTGSNKTDEPSWEVGTKYQFIDISCMVAKQGEPAKRMLRAEAQELQRSLGDTVEWFFPDSVMPIYGEAGFGLEGTYTYAPKATIKLDGNIATPEQVANEMEIKRDTHELWWMYYGIDDWVKSVRDKSTGFEPSRVGKYELRPKALKQDGWKGTREDVIDLLKDYGLLDINT